MRPFFHRAFFNPWNPMNIMGTDGRDFLFGFFGDDVINAYGGHDYIFAGWGNDIINAGTGNDTVNAGFGNDEIDLGEGDDTAFAGHGDDTIRVGAGNDRVFGGQGIDTVIVDGGFDDYSISFQGAGFWSGTILSRLDGAGGVIDTNTLRQVEVIEFGDYTYYLDGRNNAVFARDDVATTDEDTVLTINAADLLANDEDPDGDAMTVTGVDATSASGASVTLVGGQISYDPGSLFDHLGEGESATDTFSYTVDDGNGGTDTATVTITIEGRNDAPVLSGPSSANIAENSAGVVGSFSATDVDGDSVTFSLGGADAAFFTIDAAGNLSLAAPQDFEAPADAGGDNVYDVQVIASDGTTTDTLDFALTITDVVEYSVVISEIMYNPASDEDNWEWVEIVNTGSTTIDLAGWVLDDINGAAHDAANIASGTLEAGGSAILYNADDISAEDFSAAWGLGINLIAVTGWSNGTLNNGGDTVGLWSSFADYSGDHADHLNAVVSVTYDDGGVWPSDDNSASIYLTDLNADANDGANWARSTDGGATPVNTGETSVASNGNSGADVGSPGGVLPAGDVLISEFRPNPAGSDPATTLVELSGNPGGYFEGYILSIESDPGSSQGRVDRSAFVSGTFDSDGLLTVEIPDLENPSLTLVVTDDFTGDSSTDIDTNDDGIVDDLSALGEIHDAIGVPDNISDEASVYGEELGGTDMAYTGAEPELIFREGSRGDLYAVNNASGSTVIDVDGNAVDASEFSFDPLPGSFGDLNPVRQAPQPLSLVINEILADPASDLAGDANGDGVRSATDDEFVEIVNTGTEAADLSGVTISDAVSVRHTFAEGTTLAPGAAIVVFGGGTPTGDFGGAQVVTASAGSLGLNNSGDTVTLADGDGAILDEVIYGSEGGANQSLTRDPDLTGEFAQHETVSDDSFSPGTGSDGTPFGEVEPEPLSLLINEILADPAGDLSGDANGDGTRDATQDEFVEIINTGSETADLSGVTIADGNSVRHVFAEGTMLAPGSAIVVFGGGTPTGLFGGAQVVTASTGALGLNNGGDVVTLADSEGAILDQVTYGSEGGANQSLTRSPDIVGEFVQHETVSDDSFSPGTGTDGAPFGGDIPRNIAFNEIRHSQGGDDLDEFFELFTEFSGTSLEGVSLIGISGEFEPGQVDFAIDLSGGSFDADGIFMIARPTITTGTFDDGDLELPEAVALFGSPITYMLVEDFTGAANDDLDTDNDGVFDTMPWGNVLDAVSFVDGDATADVSYSSSIVGPDGSFSFAGIAAMPDGSDTFDQLDFGDTSQDTPGELNDAGGGTGTELLIHDIQGSGSESARVGETVTVTAIVVGDFQTGDADDERNLRGFFLQEEDADHDADLLTSEGIFVFESSGLLTDVSVGDRVTVTGVVGESFGQTQIVASSVSIVDAGAVADVNSMAVSVSLPTAGAISDGSGGYVADLEAYEGMLATFPNTLTIHEAFNLDRFGEIRLTAGDRPVQFTQTNNPDVAGFDAHQQTVASNSIVYDDGKTVSNPDSIFPEADLNGDGVFNTADGFGMGDTVTGLTGVVGFSFSEYRVHSVEDGVNTFVDAETREETPPDLTDPETDQAPDLVIASFNVLNFFTTLNDGSNTAGPGGLNPRGAETADEYARQLEKLLTTLTEMDADIFGLVELENEFGDQNGDGTFAIEAIVDGLNVTYGDGVWDWVDPGRGFVDVSDAISVGMIYRTDKVSLDGSAHILDDTAVANELSGTYETSNGGLFDGTSTNRAPLAANFTYDYMDIGGENVTETFTVAVTHMKSKGPNGSSGADADQNDGAGAYNDMRTQGVEALTEWLDADRAGGFADVDQIVLGDFNAYAREDPIDAMIAEGYVNLEEEFNPGSTTYVFDGQTGSLDYGFASASLLENVTNAAAWHINSDEPDLIDYNLSTNGNASTVERDASIFDGSEPFRTSDHDPLLLGLNFSDELIFTT